MQRDKQTSFLKKSSQRLTAYDITHQNFKYALKVRCGTPHLVLRVIQFPALCIERMTHVKASLLKARNTVKEAKNPVFKPIVWQVDAYDKLSCERRVRAHPVPS